jgi:hypothetical protein
VVLPPVKEEHTAIWAERSRAGQPAVMRLAQLGVVGLAGLVFQPLGSHADCTSSAREEIENPLHPPRHAVSDAADLDQLPGKVSARFQ